MLHASTVQTGGRAVAFVAQSGGGKSTLAALACAQGALLVTDDVQRTCIDDAGVVRCVQGSGEARLRRPLGELVDVAAPTRTSVDGRTVWSPEPSAAALVPLAAIVLPTLSEGTATLTVARIAAGAAVLELTRRPRLLGPIDAGWRAREFANLARIVRAVPVYGAVVPWGPPFEPVLIEELLACVGVPLMDRGMPTPAA